MGESLLRGQTEATAVSWKPKYRRAASKVPDVTVYFWLIKVLTTGMGETTSDYLVHQLPPLAAVAIGGAAFAAALVLQFAVRCYVAWIYWPAVVMVSVFGTMAADVLHIGLGIPYVASTVFFSIALLAVFLLWHRSEKTLSIHSIHTRRREGYYWASILITFALGTAVGDMTAMSLNLGYLGSGMMFTFVIAVPAVAHRRFRPNPILAFWSAYIVTRPLGASFADWMAVSQQRGGLNWGAGPVSLGLSAVILVLVGYLAFTRKDVDRSAG
ncbi:hypothetical protein [Paenarthrobacter sp. PH39-S1]|uniref:COG4705 family protein n=1 Tax=Paenarthrobacter sp. PH39-S1 TaxID=3046204 RepID=UPI0024B98639|nr:hypothetical protein [Paenarthrobacter sp. PH39-S1]MDJ0355238.1 hypothetical protein [Paenarthrobacter sp. PH39-S1]